MKKQRMLRPFWILLAVMAGAAALFVLLMSVGVFKSYRYDGDEGTVGGGTVEGIVREIEIDWLVGPIRIEISEDDRFLSVSEYCSETLGEAEELRRGLDESGRLTIRARSSTSLMLQSAKTKLLVIRIPADMAESVERLSVRVREGAASVELSLLPNEVSFEIDRGGEFKLTLPSDAGFVLNCEGLGSAPVGAELVERDGAYVRLDGGARITVKGSGKTELTVYGK